MKFLPLNRLGAREASPGVVDFGLFLPWVSAENGNRLWVKIIHEKDQFLQNIPPLMFEMAHSNDSDYGDYWSVKVDITSSLNLCLNLPGDPLGNTFIDTAYKTQILMITFTPTSCWTGLSTLSPENLAWVNSPQSH